MAKCASRYCEQLISKTLEWLVRIALLIDEIHAAMIHRLRVETELRIRRGNFMRSDSDDSDWYVDSTTLMLHPDVAAIAGALMVELLDDEIVCVGGPATSAIPVVAAIVHRSPRARHGFLVRSDQKTDGPKHAIEGRMDHDVAIVNDICATGESLLRCVQTVERAGASVRLVASVFDRDWGGKAIRDAGYDYRYVLRLEDGRCV